MTVLWTCGWHQIASAQQSIHYSCFQSIFTRWTVFFSTVFALPREHNIVTSPSTSNERDWSGAFVTSSNAVIKSPYSRFKFQYFSMKNIELDILGISCFHPPTQHDALPQSGTTRQRVVVASRIWVVTSQCLIWWIARIAQGKDERRHNDPHQGAWRHHSSSARLELENNDVTAHRSTTRPSTPAERERRRPSRDVKPRDSHAPTSTATTQCVFATVCSRVFFSAENMRLAPVVAHCWM